MESFHSYNKNRKSKLLWAFLLQEENPQSNKCGYINAFPASQLFSLSLATRDKAWKKEASDIRTSCGSFVDSQTCIYKGIWYDINWGLCKE